ncbi:MAG: histidinol-phosphate transaminase, partial [Chloroflexi bacterium]|nr:histidinol-phosphate transaminase [Chloroflexota bacterium]
SPKAVAAIEAAAKKAHLYPDDSMYELKAGLSKRFGVEQGQIVIGAGSDQVLEFAARALLNPQTKVLMSRITFAMYAIYAAQQGAQVVRSSCYRHDLEEFARLVDEHDPAIVHICTPNNPTGDAIDRDYLYAFLERVREPLVIVDGAYMEYAAYKDDKKRIDPKDLVERFENVLYLGTFSKAYGLGGMRVGYGIARPEVIAELSKLRPPFNITTPSLAAATAALADEEHVRQSVAKNFAQMDRYVNFARKMGFDFIESYTNFITYIFDESKNATKIADALLRRGVIVRDLASYGLNAIRVTIGTKKQNDIFFERFGEVYDGD